MLSYTNIHTHLIHFFVLVHPFIATLILHSFTLMLYHIHSSTSTHTHYTIFCFTFLSSRYYINSFYLFTSLFTLHSPASTTCPSTLFPHSPPTSIATYIPSALFLCITLYPPHIHTFPVFCTLHSTHTPIQFLTLFLLLNFP